jgi:hypothetical protein
MMVGTETIHSHNGFLLATTQFAELERGFKSVKR